MGALGAWLVGWAPIWLAFSLGHDLRDVGLSPVLGSTLSGVCLGLSLSLCTPTPHSLPLQKKS